jgi:hypothetical protein
LQISTNSTGLYVSTGAGNAAAFVHNGNLAWAALTNSLTTYKPLAFATTDDSAATRTNLGLGFSALTNTSATNFVAAVGLGATNDVQFNTLSVSNAAQTRTNLSLGASWLTNTSATNFRSAIGLGATAQTQFSATTNDQSVSNTTNFVDVTNMSFLTEANARYVVTASILVNAAYSTPALTMQFVFSNATGYGSWTTTSVSTTNLISTVAGIGTTNARAANQVFYVEGGTNAGEVKLQMSQSFATNSVTNTIQAGSWIRAEKMP